MKSTASNLHLRCCFNISSEENRINLKLLVELITPPICVPIVSFLFNFFTLLVLICDSSVENHITDVEKQYM